MLTHRRKSPARRPVAVFAALVLGVMTGLPTGAAGQARLAIDSANHRSFLFDVRQESGSSLPDWLPPVSSLLIPGSGQFMTGVDRAAVYVIAEVFLLTTHFSAQRTGRRKRDAFHDLAFTVARAAFDPMIVDTTFEYFEQMEKFVESGPFDADPQPGIQPATDESTFNGSLWALARRNFFADPNVIPDPNSAEYQRAIEFYMRRAVGPNFLWSWRGAAFQHDLFKQTVRQSNDAFRRGSTALGLLLANHLLSAVDAFVTRRLSTSERPVAVEARVRSRELHGFVPRLEWTVTVAF